MDTDAPGWTRPRRRRISLAYEHVHALIAALSDADFLLDTTGTGYLGVEEVRRQKRQIKALSFILAAALPESERPAELRLEVDARSGDET